MKVIYLAGDSTMSEKLDTKRPESGWGEHLFKYLPKEFKIVNYAKNGMSAKSFYESELFEKISNEISDGDFLVIQFGHNDFKPGERYATEEDYKKYLIKYIEKARNVNCTPVLVTPVCRRIFENSKILKHNHFGYPEAMKEVAKENNVHLLDMTSKTLNWLNQLGEEESKKYFLHLKPGENSNYPNGKEDDTHFNVTGADVVASMIANELLRTIFSN